MDAIFENKPKAAATFTGGAGTRQQARAKSARPAKENNQSESNLMSQPQAAKKDTEKVQKVYKQKQPMQEAAAFIPHQYALFTDAPHPQPVDEAKSAKKDKKQKEKKPKQQEVQQQAVAAMPTGDATVDQLRK